MPRREKKASPQESQDLQNCAVSSPAVWPHRSRPHQQKWRSDTHSFVPTFSTTLAVAIYQVDAENLSCIDIAVRFADKKVLTIHSKLPERRSDHIERLRGLDDPVVSMLATFTLMAVMIVVLYSPPALHTVAQTIRADLENAFNGHVGITTQSAEASSAWPVAVSWDDLLVVVYDTNAFPATGKKYVSDYLAARSMSPRRGNRSGLALGNHQIMDGIKALAYDDAAKGIAGRIAHRAGCMLGLRLQGRDSKIFISYRGDGKYIADQLYDH